MSDDFLNTVEQAWHIEDKTIAKLDQILEMYKRIRRYHFERKRAYGKMRTTLAKGMTVEAGRIYRNEMPKPLKYIL